jgi:NAD(P)-dependent dehydrogenase (short-subunit alcohol dehydrogenase family)
MAVPEDAQAVVEAAMKEFGHVDVLVNNAGKGTAVPATRETPAQFREVIDINLNGCYWMAQACGRVMQPGSAIISQRDTSRASYHAFPRAEPAIQRNSPPPSSSSPARPPATSPEPLWSLMEV